MDTRDRYRSSPRPQTTHPVTLYCPGEAPVQAYTRDVSRGGLFVFTEKSFEPGQRIEIDLSTPSTWEPLRLTAEVCRVTEPPNRGVGLRFVEMSDRQVVALIDLTNSLDFEG